MFRLFKRSKKSGCPNCYERNIVAFGSDYLESKYISSIKLIDEIGETKIYQCSKCLAQYCLNGKMYEMIFDGQFELLKEWSKRELSCTASLKAEIDKIGLTNNFASDKMIPCKIELYNGKEFDFSTILFSNNPPIGSRYSMYKNLFFIEDIKHVTESEYAVSFDIRNKAEMAEERRMGFYPIVLKNRDGLRVVLNGFSAFFNSGNIKGSELILANEEWNSKTEYTYDTYDYTEKTIVIAKK